MLSRQWPRPISRNAASHAHQRVDHGGGDDDAERLHERHHDGDRVAHGRDAAQLVAQRADRHRPGVEAVGRQHVGQERRRAGPSSCAPSSSPCIIIHHMIARSTAVTAIRSPPWPRRSRPFNARSLVLSVLLGLDPPVLPARSLVAVGELFGIAAGTMRTALSRMVAAGELTVDGDGYRLVGRLLERKAAQDIGRRPAPRHVGRRVVGRRRHGAAPLDRRAAGVPHAHGQPAHGRAAARHVDAPGQPRRPGRRRRRWPSCAARSTARTRRSWPAGCGRSPTLAATADALDRPPRRRRAGARRRSPGGSAAGDHARRRGRPLPARRAAAAAVADAAAVAARRRCACATATFDRRVGRALRRLSVRRSSRPRGSASGAMSTPKCSLEPGVVLGVVLDGAERDPVGVVHRRAALDQLPAAPAHRVAQLRLVGRDGVVDDLGDLERVGRLGDARRRRTGTSAGTGRRRRRSMFGASMLLAKIADFVTPGSMMTTRMPNGASSWARPSLTPSKAYFDATYGDWAIAAIRPAIDVMLTIAPLRRSRICGSTRLEAAHGAAQVDVHHVEVQLRRRLLGHGVAADAGVVDEHVDAAGLVEDLGEAVAHRRRRRRRRARRGGSRRRPPRPSPRNLSVRDVARTVP